VFVKYSVVLSNVLIVGVGDALGLVGVGVVGVGVVGVGDAMGFVGDGVVGDGVVGDGVVGDGVPVGLSISAVFFIVDSTIFKFFIISSAR
jgi:hypothetical protein